VRLPEWIYFLVRRCGRNAGAPNTISADIETSGGGGCSGGRFITTVETIVSISGFLVILVLKLRII
jgi:hypothetical protein